MIKDGIFIEFPVIKTERLTLRKLEKNDVEKMFKIFSNEKIMQYYGRFPMTEITEAEELMSKFSQTFESNEAIRWGIELKDRNIFIGTCGFHNWKKSHSRTEIGYELAEEHWGYGYMKEAVGAIVKYGFEQMDLNRIEAVVYPENIASEELLKRLGFQYEGLLRKYAYFREMYQDLNMLSLLRQEYK
ncbi:GNAT family protein [Wukongibacter baidiensis]|uniref:GNAT family N-acetyltransferase n=1 Tax=Wukongibacter baidiensis TaxID=1723361 RepID=UPI003D7F7D77